MNRLYVYILLQKNNKKENKKVVTNTHINASCMRTNNNHVKNATSCNYVGI